MRFRKKSEMVNRRKYGREEKRKDILGEYRFENDSKEHIFSSF